MTSDPPSGERAPKQDRSKQSWERVLAAGMELFEENGWEGLTIAQVCTRAQVSPPSIYARVQGKSGLFLAVYERWLQNIAETERALVGEYVRPGNDAASAATAAAEVVIGVFDRQRGALRSVIDRSASDAALLARGSAASGGLVERLAATIPTERPQARQLVRAVYAECLLRVMYGPSFLQSRQEQPDDFRRRVIALAHTLAAPAYRSQ